MNRPPKGDELRRMEAYMSMGRVYANEIPDMKVQIKPISYWIDGTKFIEYAGGMSPEISRSIGGAKWALIVLSVNDGIAVPVIKDGAIASNSPQLPTPLINELPLAAVYVGSGTNQITNEMIYDVRGVFGTGVYPTSHTSLTNTEAINSHPISAIKDLSNELNNRPTFSSVDTMLSSKSDINGTPALNWTMNSDQVAEPSSDISFVVNRGTMPNVALKWNEQSDTWQFTNDGQTWYDFSNAGYNGPADSIALGMVKLSVEPEISSEPIAIGTNDSRILNLEEKQSLLDHLETFNDPHRIISQLLPVNIPAHTHSGLGECGVLGIGVIDTPQIKDNAIIGTKISDGSVSANKIVLNSLTREQIAIGSITGDRLADATITNRQIMDNTITYNKLSAGSIATNHIQDGNVTGEKIAVNSIDNTKLTVNSVDNVQIVDKAVGINKLSTELQTIINGVGNLAGIADESITSIKLADNSVINDKILDGEVSLNKLSSEIQASFAGFLSTVTTNDIQNNSITAEKLAIGIITDAQIVPSAISEVSLSQGILDEIRTTPISLSRIEDNSIGFNKLEQSIEILINSKENSTNKGLADGYAPLNSESKIPLQYMPQLFGDMLKSKYDSDDDGIVDVASVAQSVDWLNIVGKPSTFNSNTHTHSYADITVTENAKFVTDAQITSWNSKANETHAHVASDIVDDASHRFVTDIQINEWNNKQGLFTYTPEDSSKKDLANGYVGLDIDSLINVSHIPAISALKVITDDANRFVSDIQISNWNNKQNQLGYTAEDVTKKNAINGYAGLDENGLLDDTAIPNIEAVKIINNSSYRFVTDTEKDFWNNKAEINHNHSANNITEDETHRFVTDAQINNWNSSTSLGYTAEDVANKNIASGYAGIDAGGKISVSLIPDGLMPSIISTDENHRFVTDAQITSWSTSDITKVDKSGADDIVITDFSKGVILKSPNGTSYRITVDDSGTLITTVIV